MSEYLARVARDVLRVLAAAEEPIGVDEIADRSGHPSGSVEAALRGLIAGGRLQVGRRAGPRRPRDLHAALGAAIRAARRGDRSTGR